jgi:hypothetical protein
MDLEEYRWLLVDDFIKNFNLHRINHFRPSELICVDESMSRWYGHGGEWINAGLPNYVAIERKPENGCEIQNAACGVSGVMLQLKLVKTTTEMSKLLNEADKEMLHGIVVLKELVNPWFYSQRIVCADSYFASVRNYFGIKLDSLGLSRQQHQSIPCTIFLTRSSKGEVTDSDYLPLTPTDDQMR